MARYEIGVQVGFDHIVDREAVLRGLFKINLNVALRIDYRRHSFRSHHVGSVRQAGEIELLEIHTPPSFDKLKAATERHLAELNRFSISGQFTTFHHAPRYSGRRF